MKLPKISFCGEMVKAGKKRAPFSTPFMKRLGEKVSAGFMSSLPNPCMVGTGRFCEDNLISALAASVSDWSRSAK